MASSSEAMGETGVLGSMVYRSEVGAYGLGCKVG